MTAVRRYIDDQNEVLDRNYRLRYGSSTASDRYPILSAIADDLFPIYGRATDKVRLQLEDTANALLETIKKELGWRFSSRLHFARTPSGSLTLLWTEERVVVRLGL